MQSAIRYELTAVPVMMDRRFATIARVEHRAFLIAVAHLVDLLEWAGREDLSEQLTSDFAEGRQMTIGVTVAKGHKLLWKPWLA